jgi:hypothetical protein
MNWYKSFVTKFVFKTLLSYHKTLCHIRFTLSFFDLEAVRALSFMSTFPSPLPPHCRASDKMYLQRKLLFMVGLVLLLNLYHYFDVSFLRCYGEIQRSSIF